MLCVQVFCDFLELFVFPKLTAPHYVMYDNLKAHLTAVSLCRLFVPLS